MDSSNHPAGWTAVPADEIQQQIGALTDASEQRHRLQRGTPEYEAALETEGRIATYVWRLATTLAPPRQTATRGQKGAAPES